ncbi:MAG: type II toxin-antitoxin system HicA family toxin [Bacteroidales bacterium]|jgi:predicted RNA binding protein YcfA (HicA-like mRNA interferase family)|nr:type II toxin-antitoxin system HicA family toxin [Bacteroidales bacterium]MBR4218386.1 type II toxin-antitoxin system HicA family toxin [Bacteroidales bacterium]
MKKEKLIKHLRLHNCYPTGRQKGSHAWFVNKDNGKATVVPMHNEINDLLIKKICKQLDIPPAGNN